MKTLLLSAAMITFASSVFASNPMNIGKHLSQEETEIIESTVFNFDSNGRVESMTDDDFSITIDYTNLSKGDVTLVYVDKFDSEKSTTVVTLCDIGMMSAELDFDLME